MDSPSITNFHNYDSFTTGYSFTLPPSPLACESHHTCSCDPRRNYDLSRSHRRPPSVPPSPISSKHPSLQLHQHKGNSVGTTRYPANILTPPPAYTPSHISLRHPYQFSTNSSLHFHLPWLSTPFIPSNHSFLQSYHFSHHCVPRRPSIFSNPFQYLPYLSSQFLYSYYPTDIV